jgi:hypothetical protein
MNHFISHSSSIVSCRLRHSTYGHLAECHIMNGSVVYISFLRRCLNSSDYSTSKVYERRIASVWAYFKLFTIRPHGWGITTNILCHESMSYAERLNSVFGLQKVDQKHYNSSIKLMDSRSRPMRFLCSSNHEKGALRQEIRLFHYPP